MDTLGFEPRAFRMRSGCDTTTPCALEKQRHATHLFIFLCCNGLIASIACVCPEKRAQGKKTKCRDPGSNRGPSDLQSDALPTELSRLWHRTTDADRYGITSPMNKNKEDPAIKVKSAAWQNKTACSVTLAHNVIDPKMRQVRIELTTLGL